MSSSTSRRRILGTLWALWMVAAATLLLAQAPALSTEEQRQFLLTARVVDSRPIGRGVTGALRLTLDDGRIRRDAGFQTVDEKSSMTDIQRGRRRAGEIHFVDSYRYNIAAYELAVLLGLGDMMPVTVKRTWKGQTGSLTWWVEDVLMDENEREQQGVRPPDLPAWIRARQRMFVFAELVRDTDRNKGNVLYTRDWRVLMIDFTRAFRLQPTIARPEALQQCDRRLFERLQTITAAEVRASAGEVLTRSEIAAVMARRDRIVEHYQQLIRQQGEDKVLY